MWAGCAIKACVPPTVRGRGSGRHCSQSLHGSRITNPLKRWNFRNKPSPTTGGAATAARDSSLQPRQRIQLRPSAAAHTYTRTASLSRVGSPPPVIITPISTNAPNRTKSVTLKCSPLSSHLDETRRQPQHRGAQLAGPASPSAPRTRSVDAGCGVHKQKGSRH